MRFALLVWLTCTPTAHADDILRVDLNGDGRADQIAIIRGVHDRLQLDLAGGRTLWLRLSKPVRQLAAGDVDHDGDIDLVATTDGPELLTWLNRGRGRFAHRVVAPGPPNLLPRPRPTLAQAQPTDEFTPGVGTDDAILVASRASVVATDQDPFHYFAPAGLTRTSAPFGPRAPPLA